ncbi:MAG TPA: hypothetical protein PK629_06470 [Oscillospiraceae bacterium]|nr:hypothetical protein [Oscillospiraceae bacterium]HPF55253.1 hypothetical protein [Clostridiales bacterium]HPK36021.1 hypothetical protein [Oscillospiraceae bacterium]HPR76316.1 hypothetical protein [Oscillospiraceae bacterium]
MMLSALVDFPDDARNEYHESTVDQMMAKLQDIGVRRLYFQYYSNRDYGYCWDNHAPGKSLAGCRKTAENMPNFSRVFAASAKRHGIEPVAVMRPQEQGNWTTCSPYYEEVRNYPGIARSGGFMQITTRFTQQHPELRIKRRSWDLNPDSFNQTICSIKLKKQNAVPSRIEKQHITIYISDDNAHYQKYQGDFTLTRCVEKAQQDVILSEWIPDYGHKTLTRAGDAVEVLTLSGLSIDARYVVVGVNCPSEASSEERFTNTPVAAISIYDKDGTPIDACPGGDLRGTPTGEPHIVAGFNYDDGFGVYQALTLDKPEGEGYMAICKGKNQYVHGALCACEPAVQAYWLSLAEQAMDDGFEMISNRIECHSVHVDEPFAYGYNDCIKAEYARRWGAAEEQDMELDKIAEIRGDAYTKYLAECARRARNRGKKVCLILNMEMLHNPIPYNRRYAYPMNVEWQWERWLKEVRPDEITIRTYFMTPEFVMNDPQSQTILKAAEETGVPLTYERYCYWDFAADFEYIRSTGKFDNMTLYETADVIESDGKGGINILKPELLDRLKELTHS